MGNPSQEDPRWEHYIAPPNFASFDMAVEYLKKTLADSSKPSRWNTLSLPSLSPTTMFCQEDKEPWERRSAMKPWR